MQIHDVDWTDYYQKFQLCEFAINDDGFAVNFTLCESDILVF